jgi:predicted kinase
MAGPEGDRTLAVRTLSGVQIPVPSVSCNASVQQLRQRIASHFGASASCRLFLNVRAHAAYKHYG